MFIAKHIRYPPFVTHGVNIPALRKIDFQRSWDIWIHLSSMLNEKGSLKEEVKHRVGCEIGEKCPEINRYNSLP